MMILARYEYYRPSTVEEAVSMLKKENTIIAGGSDVMPQLKTATIAPEALIDLSKISEKKRTTASTSALWSPSPIWPKMS